MKRLITNIHIEYETIFLLLDGLKFVSSLLLSSKSCIFRIVEIDIKNFLFLLFSVK